jgi:hypothetical protein
MKQRFRLSSLETFRLRISMDRISDSDSEDAGSIPAGATFQKTCKAIGFQRFKFESVFDLFLQFFQRLSLVIT